jgi:trimethylamine corrinoid protein
METENAFFDEAKQSIIVYDANMAKDVAKRALAEGSDPMELLNEGFIPAINKVGDLFGRGQMFLPELIKAAQAMEQVTEIIDTAMETPDVGKTKGKILIGTVEGDVHDIGKTIVVSLFRANGFDVRDIGRDVHVDQFIDEAEKFGADIIGTSALLSTTMGQQKLLEQKLKGAGLKEKYKTLVGGAPVTQRWADRIGADAYAQNGPDGVQKAQELLGIE